MVRPTFVGAAEGLAGSSIAEFARNAGWRVRTVPQLSVADGINTVSARFSTIWFDRNPWAGTCRRCAAVATTSTRTPGSFPGSPHTMMRRTVQMRCGRALWL